MPDPQQVYPGTLEYHVLLRRAERAYERMFQREQYAAWLAGGCRLDNINPPDIWLAELAMSISREKIPGHLLDLDRMQLVLERVDRHEV